MPASYVLFHSHLGAIQEKRQSQNQQLSRDCRQRQNCCRCHVLTTVKGKGTVFAHSLTGSQKRACSGEAPEPEWISSLNKARRRNHPISLWPASDKSGCRSRCDPSLPVTKVLSPQKSHAFTKITLDFIRKPLCLQTLNYLSDSLYINISYQKLISK